MRPEKNGLPQAPPQQPEAEQYLLASILQAKKIPQKVSAAINPDDFYSAKNRIIYKACQRLTEAGTECDLVTIRSLLERHEMLVHVEDAYLKVINELSYTATVSNAHKYAEIVQESAVRRKLIAVGSIIEEIGWSGAGELGDLLERADEQMRGITTSVTRTDMTRLSQALSDYLTLIASARENKEPDLGILSGFSDLDKLTGGFRKGTLSIIAARPSMGKSALAQNIAENASDNGIVSKFFSLEMSMNELVARSISRGSKVNLSKILTKSTVDAADALKIQGATQKALMRPLYAMCNTSVKLSDIREKIREKVQADQIVLIDYLQLMEVGKAENRNLEIAQITRGLKAMAIDFNVPIILLSQLNRALEHRQDKRPTLSDLRDSGSIEQDADLVLFLYREDVYDDTANSGVAEVIIAKNRNGPANRSVRLAFNGSFTSFYPLAKEQ